MNPLLYFVRQMTTSMSLLHAEKCSQNLEITLCSVLRYQTSSPMVTSWVWAIVLSQLAAVHNDAGSPGIDVRCWLPYFCDCLDASFVLHWAGERLRSLSSDWFIPMWRCSSDWQDVDRRRSLLSVHGLSLEDRSSQSAPKSCHRKTNSKGIRCGATEACLIRQIKIFFQIWTLWCIQTICKVNICLTLHAWVLVRNCSFLFA